MIPAQISFWIINASDLFFVREMCEGLDGRTGNAWSGLLSTGYFLPTILTTLGLIFYDAWQLSAVTEEEERARFFTKIFRTYSSVLFCCAAGIIWLCRPVMHVMKSNYYYAWHFVPFLVLASTCSCFNQFMNSVYVVTKKSQRSMVTMMAGAISNCIMNYFFIKLWGPVGATYASFLGLALVFTLRAVDARRMIGMRVHPARVLANAAALVFEAFVLLAEPPLYGLWTGLITLVIILYNFAGVWAMARVLLPRLLGRRGKALVAAVDGWLKPKKGVKRDDFEWPPRALWPYSAEKLFISSEYRSVCGRSGIPFSREGSWRQMAFAAPASCGSGGAAEKLKFAFSGKRNFLQFMELAQVFFLLRIDGIVLNPYTINISCTKVYKQDTDERRWTSFSDDRSPSCGKSFWRRCRRCCPLWPLCWCSALR